MTATIPAVLHLYTVTVDTPTGTHTVHIDAANQGEAARLGRWVTVDDRGIPWTQVRVIDVRRDTAARPERAA